ncbi:MAG TPA: tyrosine-protein phosphatase [Rhizomicrobium sp.]|nr:tyrosine-protein phosphatase [Rhizomicrobium sp.]
MNAHTPAFEAIHNFRDCGGLPVRGGGAMRRGRLYRSAHFPQATDADLAAMQRLGISVIVDLRRPPEREAFPCRRWPGFDARLIEHGGATDMVLPPHLAAFERAGTSRDEAAAALTQIYREMPFDPMFVALLRDYFAALADADGAVLVHCAAGKDRTGVAVALTHHVLGVDEAAMLADYLATNASVEARFADAAPMRAFLGREGHPVSDEAIRVILGVQPGFLHEAFAAMGAGHGSVDGYLTDAIGVTAGQRGAIARRLTERGPEAA